MARGQRGAEEVVESIAASAKYRNLHPATIERVVRRKESDSPANVEKRARKELHHILATYHVTGLSPALVDDVWDALDGGPDVADDLEVRNRCRRVLDRHATSRQRLPLLDEGYYERILAITGPPTSVIDLAAALHPFELRWMGIGRDVRYTAFDNNGAFVELADTYLGLEGVGRAEQVDILTDPPQEQADIAFFLMTYHCFDQQHRGSGWAVVEASPARWTVVSLPVASLGNRQRTKFDDLAADLDARLGATGHRYRVEEWETERLYLIQTNG